MKQNNTPLLLVLGGCGGCVLIGIVLVVALGFYGFNKSKGFFTAILAMENNMPIFLQDLQNKDYASAETLIDPEYRGKLTTAKLKQIEEGVVKKLGPMVSFPSQPPNNPTAGSDKGGGDTPTTLWYTFTTTVTYQKGTATATFQFYMKDPLHGTGKITDFKIEPDAIGSR